MATGARVSLKADKWRQVAATMLKKLQEKDSPITAGIADIAIEGIIGRTKSGVDVAGVAFQRYSKKYADKKGTTRANLSASGKLISREGFAFETFMQNGRIIIRIYIPNEIHSGQVDHYTLASVHNFGMRSGRGMGFQMPKREFMGLDQKIISAINSYTIEQWREIFASLK